MGARNQGPTEISGVAHSRRLQRQKERQKTQNYYVLKKRQKKKTRQSLSIRHDEAEVKADHESKDFSIINAKYGTRA